MLDNEETKSEISKIISIFKNDPSIMQVEEEICTEYDQNEVEIETLMAFDFDICDEVFDDYQQVKVFHQFLENEKHSELFKTYWESISEETKFNIETIIKA